MRVIGGFIFLLGTMRLEITATAELNTSRVLGKSKGKEKTLNPYPLTFSPNPIPS
jgi:hypothetical protein